MAKSLLTVFSHHSPPTTKGELQQCWLDVRSKLQRDARWNEDALGLYYRTLCIPPMYALMGIEHLTKLMDMAIMQVLRPHEQPALAAAMELATRAGACALVLYRRTPEPLTVPQLSRQEWAQAHFMNSVVNCAHRGESKTNDDLRCMAIGATLRSGAGAPARDWHVLIQDDARWCFAAQAGEHPALMADYPQTRQYLEPFSMLCQLVDPLAALHRLWYPSPEAMKDLPLPGGFDASF